MEDFTCKFSFCQDLTKGTSTPKRMLFDAAKSFQKALESAHAWGILDEFWVAKNATMNNKITRITNIEIQNDPI